jgi:hypothetical protein
LFLTVGVRRRKRPLSELTRLSPGEDFSRGERRTLIAAALADRSSEARTLCDRAPEQSRLSTEYAKAQRAHSRNLIASFLSRVD